MKPTTFLNFLVALSAWVLTSLACKCVDDKRRWIRDAPMTEFCCRHMQGNAWLTKGPGLIDCEAWSISNELANFSDCCGSGKKDYFSDCPCSHGCRSLPPSAAGGSEDGEDAENTIVIVEPADPTAAMESLGATTRIDISAEVSAM